MKLLLLVSLFTIFFCSCRELVQEEFPDFKPVPAVNSLLVADSTVMVHVSFAEKMDTQRLAEVNDASVSLAVNKEFEEMLQPAGDGFYQSEVSIKTGQKYTCSVDIPGYETIKCEDSIPTAPVLLKVEHIDVAGKNEEGQTYPAIQFTLRNELGENNYYEAYIRLIRDNNTEPASIHTINDPVLQAEGLPLPLFSNHMIDDTSYTMKINYTTGSSSWDRQGGWKTNLFPIIFELRSVSYDYYRYVQELYLYEKGRYSEFIEGTGTRSPLYSNIENAYGIFAGYSKVITDTIYPNNYRDYKK